MAVRVLRPGMFTTVQDLGRPGLYTMGIPPSGSLDQYSALAANLLVNNDDSAAVLEFTYIGPYLLFERPALVAVAGANIPPLLNGQTRPLWESFAVSEGDVLSFGDLTSGARGYVAIGGGFDVPVILGSRSTFTLGAIGGINGRALEEGDWLPTGEQPEAKPGRRVDDELRPHHGSHADIRIMPSLFDHRLTDHGLRTLLDSTWTLTSFCDRSGFRYQGPEIELEDREPVFGSGQAPSNVVDAYYPVGSIRIPWCIEPTILHRDTETSGGHLTIASVIDADLNRVAQLSPNSTTRFVQVDLDHAIDARRTARQQVDQLRSALR